MLIWLIRYNYISMALIISSFGKMLLIFMVIWDYKQLEYSWLVSIIVLASNTEALSGTELANISDPKLVKLNISYYIYKSIWIFHIFECFWSYHLVLDAGYCPNPFFYILLTSMILLTMRLILLDLVGSAYKLYYHSSDLYILLAEEKYWWSKLAAINIWW
jgi:hypothetical protein